MLPAITLLSALLASAAAASPSSDDCVLDLAVVCLDDKLLVYVHWLEKRDKLNVVGDIVTIVKKRPVGRLEDRSKLQQTDQRVQASESLGPAIDEYFGTHTLRISLPWILDEDIELELDQQGLSCYMGLLLHVRGRVPDNVVVRSSAVPIQMKTNGQFRSGWLGVVL